jgi:hypothetical protein
MFRNILLIISCFVLSQSAFCQPGKASNYYIDTSSAIDYEMPQIDFGDVDDVEEKTISTLSIQIDTLKEAEFNQFLKSYIPKLEMDSSIISQTDSSITIKNANIEQTFSANRICECKASNYWGTFKTLNLYVLGTVDMHNEIAYANLIDSKTGKHYELPTCSDPGPNNVLLSPMENHLLTFSNSYYEHDNCCIYILKVDRNAAKQSYKLKNVVCLNFDKLNVLDLVWVNEKSFVMSVSHQILLENYQDQKTTHFLRVNLRN